MVLTAKKKEVKHRQNRVTAWEGKVRVARVLQQYTPPSGSGKYSVLLVPPGTCYDPFFNAMPHYTGFIWASFCD